MTIGQFVPALSVFRSGIQKSTRKPPEKSEGTEKNLMIPNNPLTGFKGRMLPCGVFGAFPFFGVRISKQENRKCGKGIEQWKTTTGMNRN
jgi:hypothetical protein